MSGKPFFATGEDLQSFTVLWEKNPNSVNGLNLHGKVEEGGCPFKVNVKLKNRNIHLFLTAYPEEFTPNGLTWRVLINRQKHILIGVGGNLWEQPITFEEREELLNPSHADEMSAKEISDILQIDPQWFVDYYLGTTHPEVMRELGIDWIRRYDTERLEEMKLHKEDATRLLNAISYTALNPDTLPQKIEKISKEILDVVEDATPAYLNERIKALESQIETRGDEYEDSDYHHLRIKEMGIMIEDYQDRSVFPPLPKEHQSYSTTVSASELDIKSETIFIPSSEPDRWESTHTINSAFYHLTVPQEIKWLKRTLLVWKEDDKRLKLWIKPDTWHTLPETIRISGLDIDKIRFHVSETKLDNCTLAQCKIGKREINDLLLIYYV